MKWVTRLCMLLASCFLSGAVSSDVARAQTAPPGTTSAPVVDGSAQASPIAPKPGQPVADTSSEASPVTQPTKSLHLAAGTDLPVKIVSAIDSGHLRNGDMVGAVLAAPVKATNGRLLAAGTHVAVTVISVAAEGLLASTAEMTLQAIRVGRVSVLSNILEFHGKLGPRDLPDSAPAKGTEAAIAAGTVLHFKVQPLH